MATALLPPRAARLPVTVAARRGAELVAEAIRLARAQEPPAEIIGSQWQASTQEVRNWVRSAGFEPGTDRSIPEQAIAAYNQTHPDRPY